MVSYLSAYSLMRDLLIAQLVQIGLICPVNGPEGRRLLIVQLHLVVMICVLSALMLARRIAISESMLLSSPQARSTAAGPIANTAT
jgi:hypothetical protein